MISSTTDFLTPAIWGLAEIAVFAGIVTAIGFLAVKVLLDVAVQSICLFLKIED